MCRLKRGDVVVATEYCVLLIMHSCTECACVVGCINVGCTCTVGELLYYQTTGDTSSGSADNVDHVTTVNCLQKCVWFLL